MEAGAGAGAVVADASARAVAASLVAEASHHIGAGGALDEGAVRASSSEIANASDMLVVVPRGVVVAASLVSELLLSEANASVTALVGADGSLASNALVVSEALALAGLAVAQTLVGALDDGVGVVGVDHITDPGLVLGAGAAGAVGVGPLGLAIDAGIAEALVISATGAVARAAVGAVGRDRRQDK